MRRITYLILYIVLFSGFENKERRPILAMVPTLHNSRTENSLTKSENADILWIQKVLDNWNSACLYELNIELTPLPWIIFYDSSAAWHLNADESMLPLSRKRTIGLSLKIPTTCGKYWLSIRNYKFIEIFG